MEIQFHEKIPEEIRKSAKADFERYREELKNTIINDTTSDIKPGQFAVVNYTCIWNRSKDIGKKVMVLLTDGKFCVVGFQGEEAIDFYRCQDLTQLDPEIKK
jgi:hypothetical protein